MVSRAQANAKRVREWRKRQRENPEKHEEYKKKERERNKRRREKGLHQSINDLGERDKRAKRRQWRINQRTKRERDKEQRRQLDNMITPPTSPDHGILMDNAAEPIRIQTMRTLGRKKVRKDRAKAYREMLRLKVQLNEERKLKSKYKKRYQRLTEKRKNVIEKKVEKKIERNETKKALLVHEAIINRIRNRYKNSKSQKEKQFISSLICSYKMMRKLRLLTYIRRNTGISKHYNNNQEKQRKAASRPLRIKSKVVGFLERDDNTRIKAGKKSTVTRQGQKRQIRLQNDDMKNLHAKFLTENPEKISYSLFCTLKPFHIRMPTAADRETCQCKIHENLKFKLEKCKLYNVLSTQDIDSIVNTITCDPQDKKCMYRECAKCNEKCLNVDLTEGEKQVWWNIWKVKRHEKEKVIDNGSTTTTVSVTVKDKEYGSLRILTEELQKDLQKATRHIFNIRHQYKSLRFLKDGLTHEEIMVHIDFSENYSCKYTEEIQSMHFGASQRQISLHTGVAYSSSKTYAFCTVSDCLKHTPAAIWAHLHPVIIHLKKETRACRIHFVSDGPTTQYRNKQNFYMFCNKIFDYGFTDASWNFLEAAHGKGAADGIGAVIKRTADRLVHVQSKDIVKASDLIEALKTETNISLYDISEEAVNETESEIPLDLKVVHKTMQIHQLTTVRRGEIQHRVLSCFCSKPNLQCVCFEPETTLFNNQATRPETSDNQVRTQPNKATSEVEATSQVQCAIQSEQIPCTIDTASSALPDQVDTIQRVPTVDGLVNVDVVDESLLSKHCVVLYDSVPYPGIILDIDDDEEVEVRVMHKIGKNRYFWPMMDDVLWYPKNKIITLLNAPPKPVTKRHHEIDPKIWRLIEKQLDM